MKILGIDYGRSKIGMAIADGPLAEPYKVVKVKSFEDAVKKVLYESKELGTEKLIVGVSEGEMGEESKQFAKAVGAEIIDETLTTQDAQRLSMETGMGRKKRKEMEDAYAATLILQDYLNC